MSAVGGSDGSNRKSDNEAIRRKFEDFRKKESEMVKKHQRELRRISEQHNAEVERLKADHEAQMKSLQRGSTDAITARDHKYNKEMDELRNVHRKQLQTAAEDNQRREETLRKATQGDMQAQKQNTDDRFEKLSNDYKADLKRMDESFQNALDEGRESQQMAIKSNREKLESAHEREQRLLREDRDNSIRHLQKQFNDYRTITNREKKAHQIKDMQDANRNSDTLMHAVRNERNARQDSEQILRDGFEDGLMRMRERYDKALEKQSDAHRMTTDDLKAGVVNRVDNQVRRLENQLTEAKENNTRKELQLKNQMRREVANFRDAAQKSIESLEYQRDESIRATNESSQRDIQKVRGELENQMVENNRFYRGRMEEQNRINRHAYDQLKGDLEARNMATQDLTDARIKHIVGVTEEAKSRLIELNKENHTANQRLKADQMKALRAAMEDDKQQAVNRLQDQMRKQELQHAERMNQVVAKYEKQLQTLKDQMVRERKLSDESMKRMTEELARVHKMEVDQVEAKNREKVRQLGTKHSEELRQVNRRHEEKLDQVIGEMKKT